MSTMNISLPDPMKTWVEEQARTGREWAKLGGQAAALRYALVNLPSSTAARTTAT